MISFQQRDHQPSEAEDSKPPPPKNPYNELVHNRPATLETLQNQPQQRLQHRPPTKTNHAPLLHHLLLLSHPPISRTLCPLPQGWPRWQQRQQRQWFRPWIVGRHINRRPQPPLPLQRPSPRHRLRRILFMRLQRRRRNRRLRDRPSLDKQHVGMPQRHGCQQLGRGLVPTADWRGGVWVLEGRGRLQRSRRLFPEVSGMSIRRHQRKSSHHYEMSV